MNEAVVLLIKALLLTLVIEGIVIYIATKSVKWLLFSIPVNGLTNPILNLCLILVSLYSGSTILYIIVLVVLELAAVAAEAALYRAFSNIKLKTCLLISAAANGISVVLGFIIMHFMLA